MKTFSPFYPLRLPLSLLSLPFLTPILPSPTLLSSSSPLLSSPRAPAPPRPRAPTAVGSAPPRAEAVAAPDRLPPAARSPLSSAALQDRHEFSQLVTAIRQQYNENSKAIERSWGGGIMGIKSQAATAKHEKALAKEMAKKAMM